MYTLNIKKLRDFTRISQFLQKQNKNNNMKVFIKAYGWCNVLKQDGNYSLIEFNGSKICYKTLGHEFKN